LRALLSDPLGYQLVELTAAISEFDEDIEMLKQENAELMDIESEPSNQDLQVSQQDDIKPSSSQNLVGYSDEDETLPNKDPRSNTSQNSGIKNKKIDSQEEGAGIDKKNETHSINKESVLFNRGSFADLLASLEKNLFSDEVSIANKQEILKTFIKYGDQQPMLQEAFVSVMINLIWAKGSSEEVIHSAVALLVSREDSWACVADHLDSVHEDALSILDSHPAKESKKLATNLLKWLED